MIVLGVTTTNSGKCGVRSLLSGPHAVKDGRV